MRPLAAWKPPEHRPGVDLESQRPSQREGLFIFS
jgi:hypothetical protein